VSSANDIGRAEALAAEALAWMAQRHVPPTAKNYELILSYLGGENADLKTTIDGPDLQGKPMHTETVWTFDGKDHPVKGAAAPNTTAAYKRVNDHTFEVTTKIDGKPTVTTRVVVSADAKTLTATQTGKSADGSAVNNVIVAGKQ